MYRVPRCKQKQGSGRVLPETVVMKLVEAPHGDERAETDSQRVEDLCCCGNPDFGVPELLKIRFQVELDALGGTRESYTSKEQDDQHDIREGGREVHDLPRGFNSLPQTEVDQDPGQDKSE